MLLANPCVRNADRVTLTRIAWLCVPRLKMPNGTCSMHTKTKVFRASSYDFVSNSPMNGKKTLSTTFTWTLVDPIMQQSTRFGWGVRLSLLQSSLSGALTARLSDKDQVLITDVEDISLLPDVSMNAGKPPFSLVCLHLALLTLRFQSTQAYAIMFSCSRTKKKASSEWLQWNVPIVVVSLLMM